MSSEQSAYTSSQTKQQRVLACVLCQQRKVKCDRNFPCANCTKSQAKCVPATLLPRRRRRRFAERELLDQLRNYEHLLRQHNIDFEPLRKDSPSTKESPDEPQDEHGVAEVSSPSSNLKSKPIPEVKSFWHAVRCRFGSDDESDDYVDDFAQTVGRAMDKVYVNDGSLILGLRQIPVDLSPLHPEPAQILRLWQLFVDNVNPLLRVVHTPTVQGYVIEAVASTKSMKPITEALMFSIYATGIFSLSEEDCLSVFGTQKDELMVKYQFGCQQALANCGVLRTSDRDCLTAFYLYLISFNHTTDPRALSSISAIAIRIAQRMKLDKDSPDGDYSVLEAEMRRRLWWALVLFDLHISQVAGEKNKTLMPTFTCRIPLNVNDAELRPEMKDEPLAHDQPTEAIYAVVRSAIGDHMRHTVFNLAYNAPELAPFARVRDGPSPEGGELMELERLIEHKYLRFCNPENPLHFVATWEARTNIAKCRLMEDYSIQAKSSPADSYGRLDNAVVHSIRMLECDTQLMASPLIKGFRWMLYFNFPFPAYIHLVKCLEKSPRSEHAERAWRALNANFLAWDISHFHKNGTFFTQVCKMVLGAWSYRETALIQAGEMIVPPPCVGRILELLSISQDVDPRDGGSDWMTDGVAGGGGEGMDDLYHMMPLGFENNSFPLGQGGSDLYADFANVAPVDAGLDSNMNRLDWAASTIDWGVGQRTTW
ncbi:hypothetical protein P280DRAFT_545165 [Massarina eburnea CBS 473.64]|uniref:Zn(2)-C6 fungal-type domain-containing protein n=1 Tax=Massarina eburnea CBS 473.64 TaxID=1395130 RepID=A0A6A6SKI9_9PLEO|nr:hypothetical protein P280DRAFT_545165 [Massarina eburnea CBS 473.64]